MVKTKQVLNGLINEKNVTFTMEINYQAARRIPFKPIAN